MVFSAIADMWRGARGSVLKKEVVDALEKLSRSHAHVQAISITTFLDALKALQEEYGTINNLSNDRRRLLAKRFHDVGRQTYDNNVGGAYGLFLVSAYLEASALPGEAAKQALALVTDYHQQARAHQNVALRAAPEERRQDFLYADYESWYRAYKAAFAKAKPAYEPFLDFMDDEPIQRAFRDRVDPEWLGKQFAENFDPTKWGLR